MIIITIISSIIYLLLILAFLVSFTAPRSKIMDNEADYVSIDDLLTDEE